MERDSKGRIIKGNIPWNKDSKGLMPIPWNKGIPMDNETKMKVSESRKGQTAWNKGKELGKNEKHSKFMKEYNKTHDAFAKSSIGRIPWNKGLTGIFSSEALKKIGDASKKRESWKIGCFKKDHIPENKGLTGIFSSEALERIGNASRLRSHKHTDETKDGLRIKAIKRWKKLEYRLKFTGENNSSWLGG